MSVTTAAPRTHRPRAPTHRAATAGLLVLACTAAIALSAPLIVQNPYATDLMHARQGPGSLHWLGTDTVGRDVLARLAWGARVSLVAGIASVALYVAIGTAVGSAAGYFAGWVDAVLMRAADVVLAFPTLLIVLALVAISGQSLGDIVLAIALTGWPPVARLVRASLISLREQDHVAAARATGAKPHRIILRHLLPFASGPILVAATYGMASAILMEAGLSFLGVGVQPPTASWGNMLTQAQSLSVLQNMPWLWLPPCLCISALVLSINFIGDGLRDALDPVLSKHREG